MKKISTASFIIAAIFSSAVSANHHSGGCAEKYKQYHHKPYSNSYIHHGAMPIYKHPHYQKMPRYFKPSRGYHNPYRMNKHNSMSYDRHATGMQAYSTNANSSDAQGDASNNSNNVSIENMSFNSPVIKVKKGSTVTWKNNCQFNHDVVANDGSFKSELLKPGDTFSQKFDKAGTFNYYCSVHPSMKAQVIVED